jgi:hypothetical protein
MIAASEEVESMGLFSALDDPNSKKNGKDK